MQNQAIRQYVLGNVPLLFDIVYNCDIASYTVVIVVSPLVVLINDQITWLACKGVPRVTADETQQWPQLSTLQHPALIIFIGKSYSRNVTNTLIAFLSVSNIAAVSPDVSSSLVIPKLHWIFEFSKIVHKVTKQSVHAWTYFNLIILETDLRK